MPQNEFESNMLSDWYLKNLDIAIPMIDYDEESSQPSWIHTEFANKIKQSDFIKFFGMNLTRTMYAAELMSGRANSSRLQQEEKQWFESTVQNLYENNDTFNSLVDLLGNYTNLPTADFTRLSNWGIYNNHPTIVDLGVSNDIIERLY